VPIIQSDGAAENCLSNLKPQTTMQCLSLHTTCCQALIYENLIEKIMLNKAKKRKNLEMNQP